MYMAVLALAGAASLCSPGAVFKEHPSEGGGTLLFAVLLGSVCVPWVEIPVKGAQLGTLSC